MNNNDLAALIAVRNTLARLSVADVQLEAAVTVVDKALDRANADRAADGWEIYDDNRT